MASVLLVSNDLMFTSQISGGATARGLTFHACGVVKLTEYCEKHEPALVLFDLTARGLEIEAAVGEVKRLLPTARTIGYGPHVDEQLLQSAVDAGCTHVMVRGQFVANLDQILAAVGN
ncbi:MAG: DNA-binding NarL/FixJ family response regulator [Pirellulaceae bacterium]|jgi:DNA-binding NarL/FixJ family response regulator